MSSDQEDRREKIISKYLENTRESFTNIAKSLDMPRKTVSDVINRYLKTKTTKRKAGSGFQVRGDIHRELRIKAYIADHPGASLNEVAHKFKTTRSNVVRIKKKYLIVTRKCKVAPNRDELKDQRVKTRARRLYEKVLSKNTGCILMDDETYVYADFKQIPGPQFYSYVYGRRVNNKFKYIKRDKFAKKYLVWMAICSCGKKSQPFITTKTMNTETYIQCLETYLLPLYKKHKQFPLFWPDLASCH